MLTQLTNISSKEDLQFVYVVLILPSLFGLTMVGEGLSKILKAEEAGWLSIFFGLVFIGLIVFVYFFINGLLAA